MSELLLVTVTHPVEEDALALARALVESGLACSVHVDGPTTSVFRWQGDVHQRTEWKCRIRTVEKRLGEIVEVVHGCHPYELPELFWHPIEGGERYTAWATTHSGGMS